MIDVFDHRVSRRHMVRGPAIRAALRTLRVRRYAVRTGAQATPVLRAHRRTIELIVERA